MTDKEQYLAEFKAKLEAVLKEYPDVALISDYDGSILGIIQREGEYAGYASVTIDC